MIISFQVTSRTIELSIIHDLHAVIPAEIQQDKESLAGIVNEVKQFGGVLSWIAASASPLPRFARS
jgi:hypothetical protein